MPRSIVHVPDSPPHHGDEALSARGIMNDETSSSVNAASNGSFSPSRRTWTARGFSPLL